MKGSKCIFAITFPSEVAVPRYTMRNVAMAFIATVHNVSDTQFLERGLTIGSKETDRIFYIL